MKVVRAQDSPADRCGTCRGRGWLHVRSRPVYRPGALKLSLGAVPRERCWDCGGKGAAKDGRAA